MLLIVLEKSDVMTALLTMNNEHSSLDRLGDAQCYWAGLRFGITDIIFLLKPVSLEQY